MHSVLSLECALTGDWSRSLVCQGAALAAWATQLGPGSFWFKRLKGLKSKPFCKINHSSLRPQVCCLHNIKYTRAGNAIFNYAVYKYCRKQTQTLPMNMEMCFRLPAPETALETGEVWCGKKAGFRVTGPGLESWLWHRHAFPFSCLTYCTYDEPSSKSFYSSSYSSYSL